MVISFTAHLPTNILVAMQGGWLRWSYYINITVKLKKKLLQHKDGLSIQVVTNINCTVLGHICGARKI